MFDIPVLLLHLTVLFVIVLGIHGVCRKKSAALRHVVLSLGLLVLPIAVAMQFLDPLLNLQVANRWVPWDISDFDAVASNAVAANSESGPDDQPALGSSFHSLIADAENVSSMQASTQAIHRDAPVMPKTIIDDRPVQSPNATIAAASEMPARVRIDGVQSDGKSLEYSATGSQWSSITPRSISLLIWGFVASMLGLRIVIAWSLSRSRISRSRAANASELKRFNDLAPHLLTASVTVNVSKLPGQMPICVGLIQAKIILPSEIANWEDHALKSVLNHELAHAIRRDALTNLLAQTQAALLWFHPLILLLNRRLRHECEIACDDWAIRQGVTSQDYAQVLLNVADRFRNRDLSLCQPMAAQSSSLDQRIKSILMKSCPRLPMTGRQTCLIVSLFSISSILVSSVWVEVTGAKPTSPGNTVAVEGNRPANAVAAGQDDLLQPTKTAKPTQQQTVVKAVNLGNWLLLEPWLLDITEEGFPDQTSIVNVLRDRFGADRTEELLTTYRSNWITLSDLQAAHSLGFNAVRLPFDCGLLEDADEPGVLRRDAFRWLDHAVTLCGKAELSVILDLHGAPGGQSLDGPSGDANSNLLWTDQDARDRTVSLWKKIAEHYTNNQTVIAYDVVNEPFGDFNQDLRASMLDLFTRLYDSIRQVDSQTLIYAPATLDGFAFYGDPARKGWKHVGFTQHAYPGLFDGRPVAVRSHSKFLQHWVEPVDRLVDELDVPFLLGEYNVVFEDAGGAALTAWYANEYERRGWSTAIWTLKRLLREPSPNINSWSLLTNKVGIDVDLGTDSFEQLRSTFERIGKVAWQADEKFSQALNGNAKRWEWPGRDPWQSIEIETDVAGSSIVRDKNWVLQGAGRDIFGRRDRFMFKSRPAPVDFKASGRVLWLDETSPWAKAGWMIRATQSADSAHLMLHTTPDGKVMICGRDAAGENSWQKVVGVGGLPVQLGITRQGNKVHFAWTDASGQPKKETFEPAFLNESQTASVGMAVCSLVPGIRTTVGLDQVTFQSLRSDGSAANFDGWQTKKLTLVSKPKRDQSAETADDADQSGWSPVATENPSFEIKGEAEDQAIGWNRWGNWINRETSWSPVHDGESIIGYHHYRIDSDADSGLWQNVKVQANQATRFRILANVDIGSKGAFAKSVELRMEVPGKDGTPVAVASKVYDAKLIATGDRWSTLEVIGTPESEVVRLIVCVVPATGEVERRDGSVKFDAVDVSQQLTADPAPATAKAVGLGDRPLLKNGSFELPGGEKQIPGWSQWGDWFGRQDAWTPVRDGSAILAYQHVQTSGNESSGLWQDVPTSKGAQVKFSVHANADFGKPGTRPPHQVELKLESPMPGGKAITLAKKVFEAKHLAKDEMWSLLSIEATAFTDQVRCLIVVIPNPEDGQRDGALKFDQASVEATLE